MQDWVVTLCILEASCDLLTERILRKWYGGIQLNLQEHDTAKYSRIKYGYYTSSGNN